MLFDRTLYRTRADAYGALADYLAAGLLSAADGPAVTQRGNRYAIELYAL